MVVVYGSTVCTMVLYGGAHGSARYIANKTNGRHPPNTYSSKTPQCSAQHRTTRKTQRVVAGSQGENKENSHSMLIPKNQ